MYTSEVRGKTSVKGFKVLDELDQVVRFFKGTKKGIQQELKLLEDYDYFKSKFPNHEREDLCFVMYRKPIRPLDVYSVLNHEKTLKNKQKRKDEYRLKMWESLQKRIKTLVTHCNNRMFDESMSISKIETSINPSIMYFTLTVNIMGSFEPKRFNFNLNVDDLANRKYNIEVFKNAYRFLRSI